MKNKLIFIRKMLAIFFKFEQFIFRLFNELLNLKIKSLFIVNLFLRKRFSKTNRKFYIWKENDRSTNRNFDLIHINDFLTFEKGRLFLVFLK